MTASVATRRPAKGARAAKRETHPITGELMDDEARAAIHDMLDTIGRRAAGEDSAFMATVRTIKKMAREASGKDKDIAAAAESAFVLGVTLGARSVGRKWVKVSAASAFAYAATGQDDDVGPDHITFKSKSPGS